MHKNILPIAVFALIAGCDSAPVEDTAEAAAPSVILIIGDGMDDQQITIARNYLVGMNGKLILDGIQSLVRLGRASIAPPRPFGKQAAEQHEIPLVPAEAFVKLDVRVHDRTLRIRRPMSGSDQRTTLS